MTQPKTSTAEWLHSQMLERIQTGQWAVGSSIPSERALMEEFGVSRIPIRESLQALRALGVLDISHGRCAVVKRIDVTSLGRLFPLIISMEGQQSFHQIFEVRLALESQTAYLAARRRSQQDLALLEELHAGFCRQVEAGDRESLSTDLKFHIQIATAAKNPLFPLLLEALAEYVKFVQKESCLGDAVRVRRAVQSHESILESIRWQDAERARVEMEAHLRYSASRILHQETNPDGDA
jgi:GntR family transcriptional repressor for pyruvate dehydrogenase complex